MANTEGDVTIPKIPSDEQLDKLEKLIGDIAADVDRLVAEERDDGA